MRKLMLVPAALAAAFVLAAPAALHAETKPKAGQAAPQQGQPTPERLLIQPPPGWVATQPMEQGNTAISRLFPPGQSPQSFNETISVQRIAGAAPGPKEFVAAAVESTRQNCDGTQVGDLLESKLNNYPAAATRMACSRGKATGKGGLLGITAVRGSDALYVIQRMWLTDPVASNEAIKVPNALLAEWARFEKGIMVCDSRTKEHPCPQPKAQGQAQQPAKGEKK